MDATIEFLRRLDDDKNWVIVRNVPIFRPHVRKDKDGKVKYKVTDDDMHDISRVAKNREKQSGVVGTITLGHKLVDPQASEQRQPRVVGYLRHYRDGTFGPQKVPCVLVDLYYKPEDWDEARKYPYRSAEYYPLRKEITGVALLIRDPELDLGMVAYERQPQEVAYFPETYMALPSTTADISPEKAKEMIEKGGYHPGGGEKKQPLSEKQKGMLGAIAGRAEKSARDDTMADPTDAPKVSDDPKEKDKEKEKERDDGTGGGPPPPDRDEGPEGVPPDVHEHFKKLMHHYGLGHMMQHAFLSPTNTGIPPAHHASAATPSGHPGGPPALHSSAESLKKLETSHIPRGGSVNNARSDDPDLFRRLESRIATLEVSQEQHAKELEAERLKGRTERVERYASMLEDAGFLFDREAFVKTCIPLDDAGMEAEGKRIEKYNKRDVTHYGRVHFPFIEAGGMQPVGGKPESVPGPGGPTDGVVFTDDDRYAETAIGYQRENPGKTWPECLAYARTQANGNGRAVTRG